MSTVTSDLSIDDPRLARPILTVREAAKALGLPDSTLASWARGYRTGTGARVGPIVTSLESPARHASMPFVGVVEAHVLAAFRCTGVPMQRIRPAVERLREELGLAHALASSKLFSDGAEILYDYAEQSGDDTPRDLVVVRSGQRVFAEVVAAYLERIEFDRRGWPTLLRLPAYRSAQIVIDPRRGFGSPLFERAGVRVEDVLDRWRAGEEMSVLAEDYGLPLGEIEDAARVAATPIAA